MMRENEPWQCLLFVEDNKTQEVCYKFCAPPLIIPTGDQSNFPSA